MDLKRWKCFEKLDPVFAADIKRLNLIGMNSRQEGINSEKNAVPWKGSMMVMKNEDVYAIVTDHNSLTLLGVKETKDLLPFVPVKIDALCGQEIRAISSGVYHVVALTKDGRIYQWGQMCFDKVWKLLNPHFVSSNLLANQGVIQIASGHIHSLALTEEGEVYSWGQDIYGQLGIGRHTTETGPVKVSGSNGFEKKITAVASAGWTSYALDVDGNVWSWGSHSYGALGRASSANQLVPLKTSLRNVKKIAAGDHHIIALTKDNSVYFWGQQYIHEGKSIVAPKKMDVPDVVDIAAMRGCTISALKTAEGKIYFWGFAYGHLTKDPVATQYNSFDELFHSLDSPIMVQPLEVQLKQPTMIDKLRQHFDDKTTADITFSVQGKLIHAHKMVLMLRSDHFNNFFASSWSERTRNRSSRAAAIEIADCTYSAFHTFLLYLYTDGIGPPPRTADEVIELFKLAIKYVEEDLKRRCEQQLGILITKHNACKLYALAVQHDSKALHDIAVDFIVSNYNAVVKTGGYLNMPNGLKNSLTLELAAEDIFVGLKRKRKE